LIKIEQRQTDLSGESLRPFLEMLAAYLKTSGVKSTSKTNTKHPKFRVRTVRPLRGDRIFREISTPGVQLEAFRLFGPVRDRPKLFLERNIKASRASTQLNNTSQEKKSINERRRIFI
jgi:hypothetical protein